MTFRTVAFRFRAWIFVALYLVGFLAPWQQPFPRQSFLHIGSDTLWLASSTLLARTGWIAVETSTVAVTLAALGCCLAGTALRIWGKAWVPGGPAGPFHSHRGLLGHPLSLGSLLLAAGVATLMPPLGALAFFGGSCLFEWLLVPNRKIFVPMLPGDSPREPAGRVLGPPRPHWLKAVSAEIYPIGFTLCFAIFAWRYDALILIKCLIVCYGLSLIVRALWPVSSLAVNTVSM